MELVLGDVHRMSKSILDMYRLSRWQHEWRTSRADELEEFSNGMFPGS